MDNAAIKQATKETKRWALANGFDSDVEDMTQYVLMRLSQKRKSRVSNICIDYVRLHYGRTGSRSYKIQSSKSNEKRFYSELNEETCALEIAYDLNLESLDFEKFQNYLHSKERAILTLRFKWGMTESEIGDCFGITESRVSQKFSEIKAKLKRFIDKDNS